MADSIVRLRVDSQEYDQKLKRAAEGLQRYADQCHKAGGTLQYVEQETLDYVKALGHMDTKATTATGKIAEMKKAFTEFSMIYRNMSDEEKKGDFGRALGASLENLKMRINDSRQQLAAINQELSGSKFGQMGHVIDTIGQQFGVTGNLTEMLTSKTALLTTALGGVASAAAYAAKEWAEYNSQLAKQDQITTVTTGLKGTDAEQMTSSMRALSRTYGADFRESVNAANTLMTQFGVTGSDAIKLLRDGMQGMILGDAPKLLSMIQQFAPSFHDAGVSASQLVAVIQNSEGGIFTDQNMQAIVMGIKNLRLMTKSTAEALAQLGIDGQDMSKKMSDGSLTVFDALKQVAGKLKDVNSGSREAGEVMQAVFGRQGAMAGTNLAKAIETLNTDLGTTKKQTGELGEQMNQLQQANERLEVAIRNCFGYDGWETMANGIKTDLTNALSSVLEITVLIKNSWVGNMAGTIFEGIANAATKALGPLGDMLGVLSKIKGFSFGGGSGNKGVGYSDIENRISKLQSLDTREKRERGYNQLYQELQRKYQNVGRERYQDLGNGKGRFYIASDKTQAVERDALERRMKLLETRKESILEGKPIEQKVKVESDTTTNTTTTTTTTKQQTPQQRAQESFTKAEQNYKQALEQAAMELKAGTINQAQAKQKEMQAAEQRWKAIGDARNIADSPKLQQAQAEAADTYQKLAAEVKTATERQKAIDKATRDLENANQKLADARSEMAAAERSGDRRAYYAAEKKATTAQQEVTRLEKVKVNVETGTVDLPNIPKVIEQTVNTHQGELMTAEIAKEITQTINTRLGRIVTPDILESITQTINTKIGKVVTPAIAKEVTQVVNVEQGRVDLPDIPKVIEQTVNIEATTSNLDAEIANMKDKMSQLTVGSDAFNMDLAKMVDFTTLRTLINEKVKNGLTIDPEASQKLMNQIINGENITDEAWHGIIDKINEKLKELDIEPIKIDFKTGESAKTGKETEKAWKGAASAVQSVGSALQGLEDPGAKIAGIIGQAIANIALGFAQATAASSGGGIFAWIAAITGGLATMVSTISAIHSATGYAQGGIVEGNTYSGDQIPANGGTIGLNAGELILNKAQQGNLASQIQGGGLQGLYLEASVHAEQIRLALNNNGKRTGRGELVTWKRS